MKLLIQAIENALGFSREAGLTDAEGAELDKHLKLLKKRDKDPLRCFYEDCPEKHPVMWAGVDSATCTKCRIRKDLATRLLDFDQ